MIKIQNNMGLDLRVEDQQLKIRVYLDQEFPKPVIDLVMDELQLIRLMATLTDKHLELKPLEQQRAELVVIFGEGFVDGLDEVINAAIDKVKGDNDE